MREDLVNTFGNRLRLRVCGVLVQDESILMVNHNGLGPKGQLWIPPGGEVNYGESLEKALIREFKEETNIDIEVREQLFVFELINKPFHAVEIFYRVNKIGGELIVGKDPELEKNKQIIQQVEFVTFKEIMIMDKEIIHGIFQKCNSPKDILKLSGCYR